MFALFYVILAPFVGAFADALPKGRVMFVSNAIKVVGCLMMLFGSAPADGLCRGGAGRRRLLPAKYGILTELLPALSTGQGQRLDRGLTITSIILGCCWGNWSAPPFLPCC